MLRRILFPPTRRPLSRPGHVAKACVMTGALIAGVLAAGSGALSATPADDCLLLPVCPTLPMPSLPDVSPPIPTTTTPSDAEPEPAGGAGPAGSGTQAGSTSGEAAPAATLAYTVRTSVRRDGKRRWIDLRLTLSQSATVVAILHRAEVPAVAAVRTGRAGSNTFAITVPRRVRAGRYALKLVLASSNAHHVVTRGVSIPK
jgi:hypothetical protein